MAEGYIVKASWNSGILGPRWLAEEQGGNCHFGHPESAQVFLSYEAATEAAETWEALLAPEISVIVEPV